MIDPCELLKEKFGWSEFKTGQQPIVEKLLGGESALAVFPTGGGKSLCYQLPALVFDGLTVVVSPLIALMKDQIDQLTSRGICAVRLDSSLNLDEYRAAMDAIRSGEAKLLYVAPERFFNERFRSALDGIKISLFAIDEAHCISQWGHNFRPDYLKLAQIAKKMEVERVLALTATATPAVQNDICKAFDLQPENVICTEFFRPNLHLRSTLVTAAERIEILTGKLTSHPPGATIVYVTLQKTAEQIAAACNQAGLVAKAYHAGMKPEDRHEIQEWFMAGENAIVVATIAFGMGIDKSDIRYVYHFNPPKSIENYAQEIGRAGRDGKDSRCELLLVPEDQIVLENFVYGDTPSAPAIKKFVAAISGQADEFFVSQYSLANDCDIKPIVVKTLLTYLELDGYLESTSPRYDSYSFKPNVPSSQIIANFEGERQEFVKRLLACSQKRKVWFYLDIPAAVQKLGCDRIRVVKAIDYFGERGWIELRVSGLVHGYRKLKPIESPQELSDDFVNRVETREVSEIKRIEQVLKLAQAQSCQAASLSAHFGQPLESGCGVCSYCVGDDELEISSGVGEAIPEHLFGVVKQLIAKHPETLGTARSIARFLCGLTSPSLTRSRLSRHADFGSCPDIPFGRVMQEAADRLM